MPVVRCENPACQKSLQVEDEQHGQLTKCGACGHVMLVSTPAGTRRARAREILRELMQYVNLFGAGPIPPGWGELVALGPDAVQPVIEAIQAFRAGQTESEFKNRGELCRVLGEIGSPLCISALWYFAMLDSSISECNWIRAGAADGLTRIGTPYCKELLNELTLQFPDVCEQRPQRQKKGKLATILAALLPFKRRLSASTRSIDRRVEGEILVNNSTGKVFFRGPGGQFEVDLKEMQANFGASTMTVTAMWRHRFKFEFPWAIMSENWQRIQRKITT